MYALQRALAAERVDWLKIGGTLQRDEIAWIWCWEDRPLAIRCEIERRPFILGPCVFFGRAEAPGASHGETFLLNAAHCRLLFTESKWYADLIDSNRGERLTAPIDLWPFCIDPTPDGPLPVEHELLIYAKSGCLEPQGGEASVVDQLRDAYPQAAVIRYGSYRRDRMIDTARRSAVCAYLSTSDRGPLALAEILLCGCPAVGVPTGAPWLNGLNGYQVVDFSMESLIPAIEQARTLDRHYVRDLALLTFSPASVAERVMASLSAVAAAV